MRKRSDLFPKKYKRHQRLHNFSSWQEHLHPVYNMWWLMYHHNYWYGGTFCHHFTVLVAFSATTFPFWWHFPPPWLFSRLSEWWRFFAVTLLFWRRFLPPLLHFDGTFCPHTFFSSDLCGGAFCPHFVVLGALFAPTLMKLHYHIHNNDFLCHHPGLCS